VVTGGNTGDRPIQVGLIFTFYVNEALNLTESDHGECADIPAEQLYALEPGDEREVKLVPPVAVRFTASIAESMAA